MKPDFRHARSTKIDPHVSASVLIFKAVLGHSTGFAGHGLNYISNADIVPDRHFGVGDGVEDRIHSLV